MNKNEIIPAHQWTNNGTEVLHVTQESHKDKARRGIIRFASAPGEWWKATEFILSGQIAWVQHSARGSASATGWRGSASATGETSIAAVTGTDGKVKAGPFSALALLWWNARSKRYEMRCALIGRGDGKDRKLKSNTWYSLDKTGNFVEVQV